MQKQRDNSGIDGLCDTPERRKAKSHSYTFFDIAFFLRYRCTRVLNLLPLLSSHTYISNPNDKRVAWHSRNIFACAMLWNYIYRELTRLKRLHRYWVLLKRNKRKFADCFGTSFMRNSLWQFSIQVRLTSRDQMVNRIFAIKISLSELLPFTL